MNKWIFNCCIVALLLLLSTCSKKEIKKCEDELLSLKQEINALDEDNNQLRKELDVALAQTGPLKGAFYEIQIGAFKYFDMNAYRQQFVNLYTREEDGLTKYIIARFTNLDEAKNFLKDIKRIGVKKAFIAGVIDNKRVTVKEVEAALGYQ